MIKSIHPINSSFEFNSRSIWSIKWMNHENQELISPYTVSNLLGTIVFIHKNCSG